MGIGAKDKFSVRKTKAGILADIPVENLIFEHQAEYYQALQESTRQTDSAPSRMYRSGDL